MPAEDPSKVSTFNPRQGCLEIVENWSAIDVWHIIHANAQKHAQSDPNLRNEYDDTDHGIFRSLSNFPAERWANLCTAAGWTVYGAVALSWCDGTNLDEVWKGWLASGFLLKPLPEFERPACFLNPALVLQVNKLSAVVDAYAGKHTDNRDLYSLSISASIAAQKQPLELDMTPENLAKAPPQVAAILKSRLLQKPEQTSEDEAIIEIWDKLIKGTQWEVWSKEVK